VCVGGGGGGHYRVERRRRGRRRRRSTPLITKQNKKTTNKLSCSQIMLPDQWENADHAPRSVGERRACSQLSGSK
jgi:hypothetical protein